MLWDVIRDTLAQSYLPISSSIVLFVLLFLDLSEVRGSYAFTLMFVTRRIGLPE